VGVVQLLKASEPPGLVYEETFRIAEGQEVRVESLEDLVGYRLPLRARRLERS